MPLRISSYGQTLQRRLPTKGHEAIELDGLKKSEASQLFNISRNTINLWFERKADIGEVKPKLRQPPRQNLKINDWEKFRTFVKAHGDKTQSEMAELLGVLSR